jgi:hypothetical protein
MKPQNNLYSQRNARSATGGVDFQLSYRSDAPEKGAAVRAIPKLDTYANIDRTNFALYGKLMKKSFDAGKVLPPEPAEEKSWQLANLPNLRRRRRLFDPYLDDRLATSPKKTFPWQKREIRDS